MLQPCVASYADDNDDDDDNHRCAKWPNTRLVQVTSSQMKIWRLQAAVYVLEKLFALHLGQGLQVEFLETISAYMQFGSVNSFGGK